MELLPLATARAGKTGWIAANGTSAGGEWRRRKAGGASRMIMTRPAATKRKATSAPVAAVIVPGPWFLRHRDNAQVKAFVKGATAAAAGAIAGATVVLTRQAVVDIPTAIIAVGCLGLLWRFKIKEPFIVFGCAAAGLLLH